MSIVEQAESGPHSIGIFDTPTVKFIGRNIFSVRGDGEREITVSIIVETIILHEHGGKHESRLFEWTCLEYLEIR